MRRLVGWDLVRNKSAAAAVRLIRCPDSFGAYYRGGGTQFRQWRRLPPPFLFSIPPESTDQMSN